MANEKHLAILRQGVEGWNQWREENREVKLDLSSAYLRGADLGGAYLNDANLNGANLRRANLSEAHLNDASLSGANLSKANLSEANLIEANLIEANLSGANLGGAYLRDASISSVDLSGADLSGADLIGADLSGADLSGAELAYTVFAHVDLSKAKGLKTVRHIGPSSIGIDTIYKSNGQIPEIFLRGCGVPDIFIEYMSALTSKPFEFYSCFISYSHQDEAFAQRLHDTLQGKGVRCWLDEEDAKLGVPISRNIEHGINLTDKFLLCCSKASLNSGWVDYEIDLALHKERNLRQVAKDDVWRIIPLDLDGHLFSPEYSGGALRIQDRLAGDFTGWKADSDKFDRQVTRVIKAIRIEGE